MDLQLKTTHAALMNKKLAIAGGAAVFLHIVLLLQTLPLTVIRSEAFDQELHVQLKEIEENPPLAQPEPISQAEPKEAPIQTSVPKPQVQPDIEIEVVEEPLNTESLVMPTQDPLDSTRFSAWIESETNTHLRDQPSALDNFSASFVSKPKARVTGQESYTSPYGETHVVTRVGDRDVCYLDNNLFVKDEFITPIVMFYDCETRDPNKFELP